MLWSNLDMNAPEPAHFPKPTRTACVDSESIRYRGNVPDSSRDMQIHRRSARPASSVGSGSHHSIRKSQHACNTNSHANFNTALSNWKAFGPTSEYSDGDAEYFQVTNRLSQQHEWFSPRPSVADEDMQPGSSESSSGLLQDVRERPEYGLSTKQISALGLNGAASRLPDPVSSVGDRPETLSR